MMNEELITGLRHIAHTMERNGHSYYQHVAENAIKALEQQPRWIPVYEKLPEQEGWYLISLGGKTYGGADVDMYCKGWVKYGTHVLAWMPLPEPYKEGEADDE